jgi:hypothetical protein
MDAYATAPQGNDITWSKLANVPLLTGRDGDSVDSGHGVIFARVTTL